MYSFVSGIESVRWEVCGAEEIWMYVFQRVVSDLAGLFADGETHASAASKHSFSNMASLVMGD